MLAELKDGHVNLYTPSDMGRYWSWYEDYPANFNDSIHRLYLGTDYRIASGLKYRILDDNIGYIYYGSFSSAIGEGNLDEVMFYLKLCDGLIIDVRENAGGVLTYAERLAERFTNERRLAGYISHKTGKGHNDFSTPAAEYIDPSDGIRWQKKAVLLTNRSCYSATNTFVRNMKECPLDHRHGRPYGRRIRHAFLFGTAQRVVCKVLGMPDVRCRHAANRIRHRAGHLRISHARGCGTQQGHPDRKGA